jgi:nucleotide-binding universal stress UspA family protein
LVTNLIAAFLPCCFEIILFKYLFKLKEMIDNTFKKVLLPTDFSEESSPALGVAAELCRKNNSKLFILHVIEKAVASKTPEPRGMLDSFKEVHNKGNLRAILDRWSVMVKEKFGIETQSEILDGTPYEEICNYAIKQQVDLIVMGTHGHSGAREFSIGSTAYNVIKNACVSVLTIPKNFLSSEFRNILFPVRPVNGIWEKFEALTPLMSGEDNFIHIAEFCSDLQNNAVSDKADEIKKIMTRSKQRNIFFIQEKYSTNVAERVLDLSKKLHADLIAINATLVQKQKTFFADPYTRQVVNQATVPVFSFHS